MVSDTQTVGVFGKIPAKGDFISKGLPRSFTNQLGDWLRASLAVAPSLDDWPNLYLSSPIWYFAASRNMWNGRPWCGVLMANVDSVGRYFPLIIASPCEAAPYDWFEELQKRAIASLSVTTDGFEEWINSIVAISLPQENLLNASLVAPDVGITFNAVSADKSELSVLNTKDLFDLKYSDLFFPKFQPWSDLVEGAI